MSDDEVRQLLKLVFVNLLLAFHQYAGELVAGFRLGLQRAPCSAVRVCVERVGRTIEVQFLRSSSSAEYPGEEFSTNALAVFSRGRWR